MSRKNINIESYIKKLEKDLTVLDKTDQVLYQSIVDEPFKDTLTATKLDLGIVVLLLVDHKNNTIDRIALSNTIQAEAAQRMSAKPFHEIKIPLGHSANIIAKAIDKHTPQQTESWEDLFTPALTGQQARFNQAGAGIECSFVYPLNISTGGALIFSYFQPSDNLYEPHKQFMAAYANRVSWCLDPSNR